MITVVGLDKSGVFLEDLRISVPYQVAVSIPATHMNSRELTDALNQRRLFRLQGSLPPGAVFRGPGPAPVPRKTGNPQAALPSTPRPRATPRPEDSALKSENQALRSELEAQKALNAGLQSTLAAMAGQLTAIQGAVEALKAQGVSVPSALRQQPSEGLAGGDDAPMFLPSVRRDDVDAKIAVAAKEASGSVGDAKAALKALKKTRKK